MNICCAKNEGTFCQKLIKIYLCELEKAFMFLYCTCVKMSLFLFKGENIDPFG